MIEDSITGVREGTNVQTGSTIARNTLWNVVGTGLPLLLALVTIPILIHSIGAQRFGVLVIAWMLLGYFGFFDLGLGRATTKFLAEAFSKDRTIEARGLFWTSVILNVFLGLAGGLMLAALAPLLVDQVLNIPAPLHGEALGAFYLLAVAVPLVTVTATARGALEAQHCFGLLNLLHVPTSALTQIAPLLVLPFSKSLFWLVGALVASRLLGTAVFAGAVISQMETPFAGPFFLHKRLRILFSYGGWLTVTNVIGPLMVYADRFFIGSLSSMTAVTYYATPYEAATRLWILPQGLMRTVFPIFSTGIEIRKRTAIYVNAVKYLTLILTPVVVAVVIFASDLLRIWVGEDFARNSTLVLQLLVVGVLINSLASVPYTLLQGLGKPDVAAKFHLLELPFYLILLWYGIQYWGIVGAAVAWTIRVSADGLLLAVYVRLSQRARSSSASTRLLQTLAMSAFLIAGGWFLSEVTDNLLSKTIGSIVLFTCGGYGVWKNLLMPKERERVIRFIGGSIFRGTRWRSISKRGRVGR